MLLSIPTNFVEGFPDEFKKYSIYCIYGSLDKSLFGSGRPTALLPSANKKNVTGFIEKIRGSGVEFNYLLNAPCFSNSEYNYKFKKHLIEHLKWLQNIGINAITLTVPYLISTIKKACPEIKITVSTIACIDSVRKAKFYEELGVDVITLDYMINRNFDLLKKIRKNIKCEIQLLLNDICLYRCPFRYYHYNTMGHASQTKNNPIIFYLDYCMAKCTYIRYSNPSEIIKGRWIRPEDVREYENIGINLFKIAGRTRPNLWILNTIKAYHDKKYAGNLLDLLDCAESPRILPVSSKKDILIYLKNSKGKFRNVLTYIKRLSPKQFTSLLKWHMESLNIHKYFIIENNKLNGFIEHFKSKNCTELCAECNYCENWTRKALRLNEIEIKKYLSAIEKVLDAL